MKVLVTGAGGFIGSKLAIKLALSGIAVRALYRTSINSDLKQGNIELFKGDILDKKSLVTAAEGCEKIFHVAALANNWAKDTKDFYEVNMTGTENVLEAGQLAGIKKIVVTSTAGTIGPSLNGISVTETQNNTFEFGDYEKSKMLTEKKIIEYVGKGMNIVIVNPTRVFGPGPLSKSNAVTKIIHKYINGKWKIKPGNGEHIGNYAYIDDVVNGHLLAMEKGRSGERYLLGGQNISFNGFIKVISNTSGIKNTLVPVPLALIGVYGFIEDIASALFGIESKITYAWVKKYKANWSTSIKKSEKELGYIPTPLEDAVRKTIEWLKEKK